MKILILGTSNSILKGGWTAGLRDALPQAEITNLSVGASPGIQFGANLDMNFSAYDVVFFDSVVNDENMVHDMGSFSLLSRVTYEIISTIAAQTSVIVLGFSNGRHQGNHSGTYTARRDIAARCGAQFVGMHEMVEMFGQRIMPARLTLFDYSETHPLEMIQKQFGYELGKLLPAAAAVLKPGTATRNYAANFNFEQATDLVPADRIKTKSNSLFSRSFVELGPEQAISFNKGGACLGFNVDVLATQSIIHLNGPAGRRTKEFWYGLNDPNMQVRFIPVRKAFHVTSFRTVSRDWVAGPTEVERSPQTTFGRRVISDEQKLAFASALFWSGRADEPLPPATRLMAESLVLHGRLAAALEKRFVT